MASREEWCAEKLTKLLKEDLRISTLNEIRDHLTSVPQNEASRTANLLDLPLVFDCLNDSNTEQIDLACEVLSLCMNNLNLGESTNKYSLPLERALNHPYNAVKLMALKEIDRNVSNEESLINICKRVSLLSNIIRCIGDSDITVAKEACDIIVKLGLFSTGLKQLISNDVMTVLHEVMSISEVVRLRVYEVVVNISKDSEENFTHLSSTGLIAQIFEELDSNDVLLRMNVVELLTQLGLSRHGYNYLEHNGILSKLFGFIDDNEDPTLVQICEPGILKFFGHMANWKPIELLSKYPKFFDRLFSNIESGDLIIVGVSLDTLGVIGLTNSGKCALQSTGNKMTYAIKTIVKLLTSFPTEVRLRALNCLENLLAVEEQKNDIMQITRRWYGLFGDDPMEIILRYAKNPFSEIKLSGLGILRVIADQQWGQEEIRNTPGLVEFLLDRNIETVKEGKEAKYEIVKVLSNSTVFDQSTLKTFQDFVKEGPFYVHAVTEVAFENE
ncbi:26S proteasome non-ATPase regulatory subunit 5 [Anoplophora glabripennis]|uniref:26S proteasome non-ATPase regulatory subunit 5 n=1 Tax=Anoplophora glabripennis TaxID=217634 RepID=UPI0008748B95|nr:26S proteasome non-ATPase regulatory subunit 5 [Anoplophora glabripennis]